jgi:hypothetical protein
MARFPPSKWETHSVEELDRYLDEVLGPDAVTAKLQAAAFLAVRYDHTFKKKLKIVRPREAFRW